MLYITFTDMLCHILYVLIYLPVKVKMISP